jgi:hypothetical protein
MITNRGAPQLPDSGHPTHRPIGPPASYLKTDGSGYGKLDRGNGGGKPAFSDGQRGRFVNGSDQCDRPDHPGQGSRSGWSAPGQGGRGAVTHRHLDDSALHQNRFRLDRRRDDLPIGLGHDHNAHRHDTPPVPSEIGGVTGHYRHSRFLLLQAVNHDFRPSTAQHIEYIALINAIVRHHYQRGAVTAKHPSEADIGPGSPVPRRPITHIAQPTPQPSYSVG